MRLGSVQYEVGGRKGRGKGGRRRKPGLGGEGRVGEGRGRAGLRWVGALGGEADRQDELDPQTRILKFGASDSNNIKTTLLFCGTRRGRRCGMRKGTKRAAFP